MSNKTKIGEFEGKKIVITSDDNIIYDHEIKAVYNDGKLEDLQKRDGDKLVSILTSTGNVEDNNTDDYLWFIASTSLAAANQYLFLPEYNSIVYKHGDNGTWEESEIDNIVCNDADNFIISGGRTKADNADNWEDKFQMTTDCPVINPQTPYLYLSQSYKENPYGQQDMINVIRSIQEKYNGNL